MWWFHDGMGWRVVVGGIWNLLWLAVLIGLIVWVVGRISGRSHDQPRSQDKQDALEIAKLRYARGEITQEQFEEIKRNLAAP
jgi:putative membrane protein